MSGKNPISGKGPGDKEPLGKAGAAMPGAAPKALLCEQWEALLVDALDGTLGADDSTAFYAHRDSCLACAQLLDESKRGSEWLHFLEIEPEVPADLIGKILAKTSGAIDTVPAVVPAGAAAGATGAGWSGGWLPLMEKHAAQSRWMMTAAMAFFSIAFTLNMTLNVTGAKLSGFRLADLKPTTLANGLTRQFYVANKSVMRYYDNVRFFYELESRVREIRRDVQIEPPAKGMSNGANGPGAGQQTGKGADQGAGEKKPAAKRPGGSERAPETSPEAVPEAEPVRHPEPVLAACHGRSKHGDASTCRVTAVERKGFSMRNDGRKHVDDKRLEGSLA